MDPLLVRAARREPVEHTPVWFMRQAGRSLPEYRAVREKHSFWEVAGTPELCAEVTLQPVRRHGVDAAVMFADIMTPVLGMGLDVELVEGVGPVVDRPVRTLVDVERLRVPDPEEAFAPLLEAIRIVRRELRPDQAVVGFCGGPFTVAGYLVEGRPSREFATVKALMYREPAVWDALVERLAACFAGYVAAQARAGAHPGGAGRADDPLRHRGVDAAAGDDRGGRRRRRPRLADRARRRLGARGRRPRRPGEPRPGRPARPVGARGEGGARHPPPR